MIRPRLHRRIAWLAMLAIWLIVVAPVVSQIHAASAAPSMDDACPMRMDHAAMGHGDPTIPASPDRHPQPMEKCGYCFLLAHSPVMPGVGVPVLVPPPLAPDVLVGKPARIGAKPSVSAVSARGPPFVFLQN
jgi:hypothetical protein